MMTPIYTGGGGSVGTPVMATSSSSSSSNGGGSGSVAGGSGNNNELQATLEFCLELYKFFNVDLFLRGYYQLQVSLRVITKLPARVEINLGSSAANNNQHHSSSSASAAGVAGGATSSSSAAANLAASCSNSSTAPPPPPSSNKHKKSSTSSTKADNESSSSTSVPVPPPPPPPLPPPPSSSSPLGSSLASHHHYSTPSPSSSTSLQSSSSITSSNSARSRSFRILFRNEEIDLQDLILFRVHLQLHENNSSNRLLEELHRVEYLLDLKLCFNDSVVSSRTLQINLTKHVGIHYYRPVFFDYFHLCAVSISIHGGLIAVHITKGSLSKSPDFLLSSSTSSGTTGCVPTATSHSNHGNPYSTSKLVAAKHTHETLMNVLMESNISLKSKLVEFLQVLGKYDLVDSVRSVNFLTSYTKSSDFDRLIKAGKSKSEEEIEDFLIQCHKDIAQLCAENILLWHRFLDLVIGKEPVRVYLSQLHHYERVKRFEEGFYITENPLRSAYTAKDYTPIVELLKKSLTYGPLPLECGELDGDANTIPIIFEDQFVSLSESQSGGNGTSAGMMTLCPTSALQQHRSFQSFSSIAQYQQAAGLPPQELMIPSGVGGSTGAGGNSSSGVTGSGKNKYGTSGALSTSGGDSGIGSTALSLADECSCGMAEILLKQQRLAAVVGTTSSSGGGPLNNLAVLGNTEKMLQCGTSSGTVTVTGSLRGGGSRGGKKPPSHSKSLDLLQDSRSLQQAPPYDDVGQRHGHNHHHQFVKSATVVSSTSSTSSSTSSHKNKVTLPPGNSIPSQDNVVVSRKSLSKVGKQRSVSGTGVGADPLLDPIFTSGKLTLTSLKSQTAISCSSTTCGKMGKDAVGLNGIYAAAAQSNNHNNNTINNSFDVAMTTNLVPNGGLDLMTGGTKQRKKRKKKGGATLGKPTTLLLQPRTGGAMLVGTMETGTNTLPRRHSSITAAGEDKGSSYGRYAADGATDEHYQHKSHHQLSSRGEGGPEGEEDMVMTLHGSASGDMRKYNSTPLLSDLASMEYYLSYSHQSEIDIDQTSEESGWVSNSSETPDALHSDEDDERVIEGISSSEEEHEAVESRGSKDPSVGGGKGNAVMMKEFSQRKKTNGLQLFLGGQGAPMVVPPPKEFQDFNSGTATTANASTISPPAGVDDMIPPMTNLAPLCPPEEFRDLEEDEQDVGKIEDAAAEEEGMKGKSVSSRQNLFPLKPKKFSSLQYRKHGTNSATTPQNTPVSCGGGLESAMSASAAVTPKRASVALLSSTTSASSSQNRRGSLDCNCLLQDQKMGLQSNSTCSSNVPTTPGSAPQPPPSTTQPAFQTIPYFLIPDELRVFHPKGLHLIICVHGLDGSCHDLRLFKIYLEVSLPGQNIHFLMSEKNQDGLTFSDFSQMTDKFVAEILAYMDTNKLNPSRISFVGHSLGNIIIRSALTRPQLAHLLPKLHTFLSLSGPHLGTLYNGSGLVNMGMWLMQKWKKSSSLLQLGLKDHSDIRQTFLYKLSEKSNLHRFHNVLLCGSAQDRYVPVHSAHILNCKQSLKDGSVVGEAYREMVMNILNPILTNNVKLVRYDVHHAIASHSANSIIGRAAHIAVLDSEIFIEKFLSVSAIKYFQ